MSTVSLSSPSPPVAEQPEVTTPFVGSTDGDDLVAPLNKLGLGQGLGEMRLSRVSLPTPKLEIPMTLSCWGKGYSALPNRIGVTSYLSARLPDFFLRGDATFSAWARTPQKGRRVILSVESPFHKDSVIEFGTRSNGCEVYGYSLKTSGWIWSATDLPADWMHVALVWNSAAGSTTLYADTHARAVDWVKGDDASDKLLASTRDWRLVVGRGKSEGKMREGWDGEITAVRVWDRALNDSEIRELRRQYPEPVNPSLPGIWNDFNV